MYGEKVELTVRQLRDPEFREVMSLIDRDELDEMRGDMDEETVEELQDLRTKDESTDEERERFEELRAEMEAQSSDLFDAVSESTFEGIRKCAKYAVVPDEEDKREAFVDRAAEIESEYGIKVQQPADVEEALQDDIEQMIDDATEFVSFAIGMQALLETVGKDEGNSEQ
jgi:hypothetical protein